MARPEKLPLWHVKHTQPSAAFVAFFRFPVTNKILKQHRQPTCFVFYWQV